ncbi:MAG: cobalt-precorrin-5B (C(1))-methyltransferase [Rhodospirillaceae bacterium]|nr:cobalt-precorrin-5B (C(1))-methyltransferase [Rhodospirillaceae bacterium]MBT6884781.1 cobalt-precorrin-5B (C(1))-methyltransferase [Rhodospirillaceae bacterium]
MTNHKPEGTLRKGWTTGCCAAAAAVAAFEALVSGNFQDPVSVNLPRGETPTFALSRAEAAGDGFQAGIIKDAGDDPDVTHGAEIIALVEPGPADSGVTFRAGDGVGTVTLPGLPLAVGEPAINPAPRQIITANLEAAVERLGHACDVIVTISIPGGQVLAEKTMNGRLGIKGGLSVLGTTGVVIPYSCASWIHSIHRGVDVARAGGITHIAAATGSTSEAAVRDLYKLSDRALIDMGDFAGGLLKYLRQHPIEKVTIAGGFAKLLKLAQGHMDLHSSRSSVDFDDLAGKLADLGGDDNACRQAETANTAMEVLELAKTFDLPLDRALGDRVALGARETALAALSGDVELEVLVFDRTGGQIGRAG